MSPTVFESADGTEIYYVGPDLSEGPLPALFYFGAAGDESLGQEPFCLPIRHLEGEAIRIFSLTLPGHGEGFDKHKAIRYWADQMLAGETLLRDFVHQCVEIIHELITKGVIDPAYLATAGLSRGGFIATHIAASEPQVKAVCAFAPMTDLAYSEHFKEVKDLPHVQAQALIHLAPQLAHTSVRFYIGNRDIAVGTRGAFDVIEAIAEYAFIRNQRSPQAELFIRPSIGHRGHGTPPEAFREGAFYLKEQLCPEPSS